MQIDEPKPATRQMEVYTNEVENLDSQIMDLVDKINEFKRKREFMLRFANSPVEFVEHLVAAQIRDAQLMQTEGPTEEEIRHSSYYYQPFVEDAVQMILKDHLTTHER